MIVDLEQRSAGRDDALRVARMRLHAFMARRVESPQVAEDLTQDVLLRLLAQDPHQIANPMAWLFQVARNVVIDHYRTRRTHPRVDPHGLAQAEPADDPFDDDPQAAQRELAACLRSLVDELDEPYRSALLAVDFKGKTQADAAHAVGMSVSGMKSRVQRGRRRLRNLLTACCRVHTDATGGVSDYEPGRGCGPPPSDEATVPCRCRGSAMGTD